MKGNFKGRAKKKAAHCAAEIIPPEISSALAGLEPGVFLVDHINAALAAHDPAILVAALGRFKRVEHFHNEFPVLEAPEHSGDTLLSQ
mgnify:CR=1 FL=1